MRITLKIIIIGEPAVGKTSLVKKFVTGHFTKDYRSSIGTNIYMKKTVLKNNMNVNLQLWDIAGQERWINMRRPYYSGAKGIILVGDMTRKNSFNQIEKFWVPDVKQYCSLAPIILLANKVDLPVKLQKHEIHGIGKRINSLSVLFTSAKTGENVDVAFMIISEQAVKKLN
ncbi:MAG: Rab family GTPase [Promethearchaeota archaeon]|jgi:small GTP-binding protein